MVLKEKKLLHWLSVELGHELSSGSLHEELRSGVLLLQLLHSVCGQWHFYNWLLWPAPQASGTRSNWLLWPTPQASGTL